MNGDILYPGIAELLNSFISKASLQQKGYVWHKDGCGSKSARNSGVGGQKSIPGSLFPTHAHTHTHKYKVLQIAPPPKLHTHTHKYKVLQIASPAKPYILAMPCTLFFANASYALALAWKANGPAHIIMVIFSGQTYNYITECSTYLGTCSICQGYCVWNPKILLVVLYQYNSLYILWCYHTCCVVYHSS